MKTIITAVKLFLVLSIFTGILYPLLITGIAQMAFSHEANGSLVKINGNLAGSELIGQKNESERYFQNRPSAVAYNTLPSGGSNMAVTSQKLVLLYEKRKSDFIKRNNLPTNTVVPDEMLFASASGLDPHISLQAARLQVDRIAKNRNFSPLQKRKLLELIDNLKQGRQWGFLGEERINVLTLNIELDKL